MRTEEIGRSSLSLVADRLAEPDALRYSSVRVSGLGLALTLLSSKQDAASVARVWDSLIHSRALVLEQVANRRNRLSRISDPEVARLEDHFDRAVRRLANLTVRGPGQEGPEQFRIRLDDARREKDSAERALASQSLSFREELRRREVGLEDVRRNLPRESALVGFCRFDEEGSSRPEAIPAYAAFILGTSGGEPRFVRLGSAREIDSLVTRWREAVSGQSSPACAAAGEALRRSIWDPLKTALGSARRASIVPDGSLNLVNLAALPAPGGGFLVETGPLIHYLSSERDLLPKDPVVTKDHGFLAVGGVDFDDSPSMHALAMGAGSAGTSGTSTLVTGSAHSFRGALPGCADFRNHRFESLPGTLREVEDVSDIWDESLARSSGTGSGERPAANRPEARALVLSRQAASEVAMKTLSRDRRVLHLATHGFFLGSRCSTRTDTGISKSRGVGAVASAGRSEDASLSFSENPLRLSGLALAGANHRDAAGPDEDDGILTAEEVAALDLSGTEWAVLSACETGVGEVWAGEGVLGLRRSFQVAGARTVIMSLWSVEDESAREWMKALYEARLSRGLGTAESAREASLAVLRGRRASGQSDNPFFWGNFVVAGDWR
jgi:CHAT domain-containing protein